MAQLLPYLMQMEMTKEQSKIWLDKSLKEYAAYGALQDKEGAKQFKRGIFEKIVDPDVYKDQPYPVESAITQARLSQPQMFAESGLVAPEQEEFMKRIQAALGSRVQAQILANAGLQPQYEDLANLTQGYGSDDLNVVGEQMARIQGIQQSEKGRQTEEAGVAVRAKELEQRVKEYALQFSPDMTPKEARTRLATLYDDYRRMQATLDKGINPLTGFGFFDTDEKKNTNRAMDSMRREIESIEHKYSSLLMKDYIGAAQELMGQGWTRETLTSLMRSTDENSKKTIDYLWKQGFNPDTLLQYLKPGANKK